MSIDSGWKTPTSMPPNIARCATTRPGIGPAVEVVRPFGLEQLVAARAAVGRVGAGGGDELVVAVATDDTVVAGTTDDLVAAIATVDNVVARPAVHVVVDRAAREAVVAVLAERVQRHAGLIDRGVVVVAELGCHHLDARAGARDERKEDVALVGATATQSRRSAGTAVADGDRAGDVTADAQCVGNTGRRLDAQREPAGRVLGAGDGRRGRGERRRRGQAEDDEGGAGGGGELGVERVAEHADKQTTRLRSLRSARRRSICRADDSRALRTTGRRPTAATATTRSGGQRPRTTADQPEQRRPAAHRPLPARRACRPARAPGLPARSRPRAPAPPARRRRPRTAAPRPPSPRSRRPSRRTSPAGRRGARRSRPRSTRARAGNRAPPAPRHARRATRTARRPRPPAPGG